MPQRAGKDMTSEPLSVENLLLLVPDQAVEVVPESHQLCFLETVAILDSD